MIETRKGRIFLTTVMFMFIGTLSIQSLYSFDKFNMYIKNHINSQPRVYCLIMTAPKYFNTRARAVNKTWAPRCDRYHFVSEQSNNTIDLPIAPIENITGGYSHLTQKSTLSFLYAYENLLNEFDWLVKADDDTYLFVENLKGFLKEQDTTQPITFGFNIKIVVKNGYHSGGGGYVLSKEALRRFYEEHQKPNTTCAKDGGSEDVEIAKCLRKLGVYPKKSVDEHNRERFHAESFLKHFVGPIPKWLYNYAENKPVAGSDCCSDKTISFHYVKPAEQYLIDKMHYGFHSRV